MKKFFVALLVLCMVVSLAPAAFADDVVKVGFITDTMNEAVQGGLAYAQEYADERGFELVVFDSKSDLQVQMDNLNACVSQGIDYVIVIPVDTTALAQSILETSEQGVVVFPWSLADGSLGLDDAENVYFRYVDQVLQGYQAGEAFGAALGEEGKLAMIAGVAGNSSAEERRLGLQNWVEENPGFEIVMDVAADWDRAKAMTAAENIMTAHPDVDAIFVQDDTMAVGAIEGIKGVGFDVGGEDGILIASVGGMAEAIAMVESGEELCTIKYPDYEQIGSMFKAMDVLEEGGTPEKTEVIYSIVIDSSNYEQYK